MLQKMILINSAEFDYLEIDLEKDLFFAGDNGTGKTTSIIALFYLFSGDNHSRKLGISSDKKSFKEYYFPDERNSYLIYVFEEFFILMYRQNGEIIRYFSKQSFHIEQIKTTDGSLLELKKIRRFIKQAPLFHLSKSTDAYRQIIYGQNRAYLDFRITDIKHYDIFIDLFGQTFNVDKSIVDAKSIKMAIQKSINQVDSTIEFNYQNYMDEIKRFQDIYLFFRKFEKEEGRIDEAVTLKERLLESEKVMKGIESFISYRRTLEVELLKKGQRERAALKLEAVDLVKKEKQKQIFLNRCHEKFLKEKVGLDNEIGQIEKLKEKFSPQTYAKEQELSNNLPRLEREVEEKQKQHILLASNIENATESIEREIRSLKYQYETELKNQKQEQEKQAKRKLDYDTDLYRDQQRQDREVLEHRIESDRQILGQKINVTERQIEEQKSKIFDLNDHYRKKLDNFKEQKSKELQVFREQQEQLAQELRDKERENDQIVDQKDQAKEKCAQNKKKLLRSLLDERKYLNDKLREQRAILHTPVGSFKEFLQQSGISWEQDIYPFMDASLLSLSTEQLRPQVIDSDHPLGIKLSMKGLKQIPTQEEAENSISEYREKREQFILLHKEEKLSLTKEYQQKLEELEHQAIVIEQKISELKNNISEFGRKISMIKEQEIPNMEKRFATDKEQEILIIIKKIESLDESTRALHKKIKALNKESGLFYKKQTKELEKHKSVSNSVYQEEILRLELWLQSEQTKILEQIKEKNKSKESISKDDKLIELSGVLESLRLKLKRAQEAKRYLLNYDEQLSFIQSYGAKKSRLAIIEQNKKSFTVRIDEKKKQITSKIQNTNQSINELTQKIEKLQEGLKKSQNIEIESKDTEESALYLVDLVKKYYLLKTSYREENVKLQYLLTKLNNFKTNPFAEIAFNLQNFEQFEKLSEDSETIERLDDLKEFKDKKLDPLKQSNNQAYYNFIKNEIPSKLGTLSHSEDKFERQVKKINKNLSSIDFSIIKEIKIVTEIGNKKSVMKLLNEIKDLVENLSIIDPKDSLFFDRPQTSQDLQKIGNLLKEIRENLNGGAITLLDTIDLALEFTENGTQKTGVTQIKNESSTGGTILLKMALAVSILGLYTDDKESTFFLILDEVSRLHSHNQDVLRSFANSRGFRIVFVTPEPIYAKPDEIRYYKFQRCDNNRFEAISLNHTRMD